MGRRTNRRALGLVALLALAHHFSLAQLIPANINLWNPASVAEFIRDAYGVPPRLQIIVGELDQSAHPSYLKTIVTIQDDAGPIRKVASLSKNGQYLIDSDIYPVNSDGSIEETIRKTDFKGAPNLQLVTTNISPAQEPDFLESLVRISGPHIDQTRSYKLTADRRFVIPGTIYRFRTHAEFQNLIRRSASSAISQGNINAPVTIIAYVDYECPDCARMHSILEDHVIPKYGDKIRIVFKDFPLPYHPWAFLAAKGVRCFGRLSPDLVRTVQSDIFAAQDGTTQDSLMSSFLAISDRRQISQAAISRCMSDPVVVKAIQADISEGSKLQLSKTPTIFVGEIVLGGRRDARDLDSAIDEELRINSTTSSAEAIHQR